MEQTWQIMGMPITLTLPGATAKAADFAAVYDYFVAVDAQYSTYKADSEISQINDGLPGSKWSQEMKLILQLCEQTTTETNGYFDIHNKGKLDPSGLVKGWAIQQAAELLRRRGRHDFSIDAGGDVQLDGLNVAQKPWRIGIRNPFKRDEIVKVVALTGSGIATSGLYIRGHHIYNPLAPDTALTEVASLTVIGPNVYEADRFATAAFAMGRAGIQFIDSRDGLEGYMIDSEGVATLTTGFERFMVAS